MGILKIDSLDFLDTRKYFYCFIIGSIWKDTEELGEVIFVICLFVIVLLEEYVVDEIQVPFERDCELLAEFLFFIRI